MELKSAYDPSHRLGSGVNIGEITRAKSVELGGVVRNLPSKMSADDERVTKIVELLGAMEPGARQIARPVSESDIQDSLDEKTLAITHAGRNAAANQRREFICVERRLCFLSIAR